MKIKEITSQSRRDFVAIFVCENCGHEKRMGGYDDAYFHQQVIPEMECLECGETAPDDFRPLTTKYPEDQVV